MNFQPTVMHRKYSAAAFGKKSIATPEKQLFIMQYLKDISGRVLNITCLYFLKKNASVSLITQMMKPFWFVWVIFIKNLPASGRMSNSATFWHRAIRPIHLWHQIIFILVKTSSGHVLNLMRVLFRKSAKTLLIRCQVSQ